MIRETEREKIYAGGFLYNPETQKVLLHKRDNNTTVNPNKWAFFGGLAEGDETPIEAFIREVKEELSINIKESEIAPLRMYFNKERQTHRHTFFVSSVLDKSAMTLGEGADFDWVSVDEMFSYDLTDKVREDLEFFMRNFYKI